jgi:hypothetical protein
MSLRRIATSAPGGSSRKRIARDGACLTGKAAVMCRVPSPLPAVGVPQHADEHGPQRAILLAVDQQLGEGPTLGVAPELADPIGAVEVGSMRTWSS